MYVQNEGCADAPLNPRLCAFRRTQIPAGETVQLTLDVPEENLQVIGEDGKPVSAGSLVFWAGMGQPDAKTEKLTGHGAVRMTV